MSTSKPWQILKFNTLSDTTVLMRVLKSTKSRSTISKAAGITTAVNIVNSIADRHRIERRVHFLCPSTLTYPSWVSHGERRAPPICTTLDVHLQIKLYYLHPPGEVSRNVVSAQRPIGDRLHCQCSKIPRCGPTQC